MRPPCVAALAAFLLLPVPSMAQQVYRCGNTFSQTPCAGGAASAPLSREAAADPAPVVQGKELCASAGLRLLGLPDPDSTRIESLVRADAQVIQYAGQPIVARKYRMVINAKNTYGAYEGARAYACYLSEDERRVLQMAVARP